MNKASTWLENWPDWARLALFCALMPLFVLAIVFGQSAAIFLLCGSLMVLQIITAQHFGGYTRKDSPWMFWSGVGLFSLMAARGGFDLYESLAGVSA